VATLATELVRWVFDPSNNTDASTNVGSVAEAQTVIGADGLDPYCAREYAAMRRAGG
jgi:hypothetical protein